MTEETEFTAPNRAPPRDTGILLLAAGGFAAAFGAASCCALPLLLGSVGLGGAWLAAVAWLAAPHRLLLSVAAIACLAGAAAGLVVGRRRASACAPGAARTRPSVTALVACVLSLGAVLVVLGFVFA